MTFYHLIITIICEELVEGW